MPDELAQRVMSCIAETQHLDQEKVSIDSTFEELGIDSLDGINILFALETDFDINIPDDEAKKVRSVRDMVDGVRNLVDGRTAPETSAGS